MTTEIEVLVEEVETGAETAPTQTAGDIDPCVIDPICATAVEAARTELAQQVPAHDIGDHIDVVAEAGLVATHLFESTLAGYHGWRWAVTVSRLPDGQSVTTDEVALLPGPDALLAPAWVPWRDRVQAGDVGPGDLLPPAPDDARLVPGYLGTADAEADQLEPDLWELGLGRIRVMSLEGRDETASRWRAGAGGPANRTTRWAPEQCSTCAFMVALAGPLGRAFGVCANEYSAADGQVVSVDHGCGAHSETPPAPPLERQETLVIDDEALDSVDDEKRDGDPFGLINY